MAGLVPDKKLTHEDADGSAFHKAGSAPDHTETVLAKHETIPSYRTETYVFTGPDDELVLTVVEDAGSRDIEIGVVRFPAPGQEVVVDISIDSDANSSLILSVHDRTNAVVRSFQLNHHYRDLAATVRTTTPVRTRPTIKISHDGETVDNVYPPSDGRSPHETDRNDVRLSRSQLAINARQPATAMRLLYQVMVVGPGNQHEARMLSRHLCDALAASPEPHRAPVITDLVRALVPTGVTTAPNPPTSARRSPESNDWAISRLPTTSKRFWIPNARNVRLDMFGQDRPK